MTELYSILADTSTDDIDTRTEASKDLVGFCNEDEIDSDSMDIAVKAALKFAEDTSDEVQKNGTWAICRILNPTSIVPTLDTHLLNPESNTTLLEAITNRVITNLEPGQPSKVRSYAALSTARIASKTPEKVSTDAIFDYLADVLESETKLIRIHRSIHAVSNIGTYEAPRKDEAREIMRDHSDLIRDRLLESEDEMAQSKGLKAWGLIALSYPSETLPANVIQNVAQDPTVRPKNRNRAIRALWQLSRTYPGVAVSMHSQLSELLSYEAEEVETARDEATHTTSPAKMAGFIRSNTAKTFATIATQHPESVDPSVVSSLTDLVDSRDRAIHRAILALGELSDTYQDEFDKADTGESLLSYLKDQQQSQSGSTRHQKARGYGVWALLRLFDSDEIDRLLSSISCIEFLMEVPGTERTGFDRRRTEALYLLSQTDSSIKFNQPVVEYLFKRVQSSAASTERSQAAQALIYGGMQDSSIGSLLTPDSVLELIEEESNATIFALELALLNLFETDHSEEIQSIMHTRESSQTVFWDNLKQLVKETGVICLNCGQLYVSSSIKRGDLCKECRDGYISKTQGAIDI